jgi:hypothetical protein
MILTGDDGQGVEELWVSIDRRDAVDVRQELELATEKAWHGPHLLSFCPFTHPSTQPPAVGTYSALINLIISFLLVARVTELAYLFHIIGRWYGVQDHCL